MKIIAFKKILNSLLSLFLLVSIVGCNCNKVDSQLGVWWWDDTLDNTYLNFAKENKVSEIYYCSDSFDKETATFIKRANSLNIKVYWLAGEYRWLNDPANLYDKIAQYENYQIQYPKQKFNGIHLDIEPHQNPTFDKNRESLIFNLIQLANNLYNDFSNINFDYDIPFWLEDLITWNGVEKPAYAHIIDIANRVFLMSYRDSHEDIYSVSKNEIEYAKSKNKTLFLGVETKSDEGDMVSFQEEGKLYMYKEIDKLRKLLPENFGVSIHQIKNWYNLKDL